MDSPRSPFALLRNFASLGSRGPLSPRKLQGTGSAANTPNSKAGGNGGQKPDSAEKQIAGSSQDEKENSLNPKISVPPQLDDKADLAPPASRTPARGTTPGPVHRDGASSPVPEDKTGNDSPSTEIASRPIEMMANVEEDDNSKSTSTTYDEPKDRVFGLASSVHETFASLSEASGNSTLAEAANADAEKDSQSQDKYASIAELDEEKEGEKWKERTELILITDHEEYVRCAKSIVDDLVAQVYSSSYRNRTEDLTPDDEDTSGMVSANASFAAHVSDSEDSSTEYESANEQSFSGDSALVSANDSESEAGNEFNPLLASVSIQDTTDDLEAALAGLKLQVEFKEDQNTENRIESATHDQDRTPIRSMVQSRAESSEKTPVRDPIVLNQAERSDYCERTPVRDLLDSTLDSQTEASEPTLSPEHFSASLQPAGTEPLALLAENANLDNLVAGQSLPVASDLLDIDSLVNSLAAASIHDADDGNAGEPAGGPPALETPGVAAVAVDQVCGGLRTDEEPAAGASATGEPGLVQPPTGDTSAKADGAASPPVGTDLAEENSASKSAHAPDQLGHDSVEEAPVGDLEATASLNVKPAEQSSFQDENLDIFGDHSEVTPPRNQDIANVENASAMESSRSAKDDVSNEASKPNDTSTIKSVLEQKGEETVVDLPAACEEKEDEEQVGEHQSEEASCSESLAVTLCSNVQDKVEGSLTEAVDDVKAETPLIQTQADSVPTEGSEEEQIVKESHSIVNEELDKDEKLDQEQDDQSIIQSSSEGSSVVSPQMTTIDADPDVPHKSLDALPNQEDQQSTEIVDIDLEKAVEVPVAENDPPNEPKCSDHIELDPKVDVVNNDEGDQKVAKTENENFDGENTKVTNEISSDVTEEKLIPKDDSNPNIALSVEDVEMVVTNVEAADSSVKTAFNSVNVENKSIRGCNEIMELKQSPETPVEKESAINSAQDPKPISEAANEKEVVTNVQDLEPKSVTETTTGEEAVVTSTCVIEEAAAVTKDQDSDSNLVSETTAEEETAVPRDQGSDSKLISEKSTEEKADVTNSLDLNQPSEISAEEETVESNVNEESNDAFNDIKEEVDSAKDDIIGLDGVDDSEIPDLEDCTELDAEKAVNIETEEDMDVLPPPPPIEVEGEVLDKFPSPPPFIEECGDTLDNPLEADDRVSLPPPTPPPAQDAGPIDDIEKDLGQLTVNSIETPNDNIKIIDECHKKEEVKDGQVSETSLPTEEDQVEAQVTPAPLEEQPFPKQDEDVSKAVSENVVVDAETADHTEVVKVSGLEEEKSASGQLTSEPVCSTEVTSTATSPSGNLNEDGVNEKDNQPSSAEVDDNREVPLETGNADLNVCVGENGLPAIGTPAAAPRRAEAGEEDSTPLESNRFTVNQPPPLINKVLQNQQGLASSSEADIVKRHLFDSPQPNTNKPMAIVKPRKDFLDNAEVELLHDKLESSVESDVDAVKEEFQATVAHINQVAQESIATPENKTTDNGDVVKNEQSVPCVESQNGSASDKDLTACAQQIEQSLQPSSELSTDSRPEGEEALEEPSSTAKLDLVALPIKEDNPVESSAVGHQGAPPSGVDKIQDELTQPEQNSIQSSATNDQPVQESEQQLKEEVIVNTDMLPVNGDNQDEEEELPIPAKKGYNLDFLDNLDDPNFNPFETKTAIKSSFGTTDPSEVPLPSAKTESGPADDEAKAPQEEKKPTAEPKKRTPVKKPAGARKPWQKKPSVKPVPKPVVEAPEEKNEDGAEDEGPVPPKKGYNLDFLDNLDDPNFNPFQTKTAVANTFEETTASSAPPAADPVVVAASPPSVGDTTKADKKDAAKEDAAPASNNSESKTEDKSGGSDVSKEEKPKPKKALPPKPWLKKKGKPAPSPVKAEVKAAEGEEELPRPKAGAYNLDFLDCLDDPNFNPFQTKTKVVDDVANKDTASEPVEDKKEDPPSDPLRGSDLQTRDSVSSEGSQAMESTVIAAPEAPENTTPVDEPIEDPSSVIEEPPPTDLESPPELVTSEAMEDQEDDSMPPPPPKGYNLDFLDNLDDPNFNPFATRSKVTDGPEPPSANQEEKAAEPCSPQMSNGPVPPADNVDVLSEESAEQKPAKPDAGADLSFQLPEPMDIKSLNLPSQIDEDVESSPLKELSSATNRLSPIHNSNGNEQNGDVNELADDTLEGDQNESFLASSGGDRAPMPTSMNLCNSTMTMSMSMIGNSRLNATLSDTSTFNVDSLTQLGLLHEQRLIEKDRQLAAKAQEIKAMAKEKQSLQAELITVKSQMEKTSVDMEDFKIRIKELEEEKKRDHEIMEIEKEKFRLERDQYEEDLMTTERACNDVKRKFERTREVIVSYKANELALKATIESLNKRCLKNQEKYETLAAKAEEELSKTAQRYDEMTKSKAAEIARLQVILRRSELKVNELNRAIEEKSKQNEELVKMCDELIYKVNK